MTPERKRVVFAVFIILTMVLGTVGFIGSGSVNTVQPSKFRGHELVSGNGVWEVSLNKEEKLTFYENPVELEKLPYIPIDKSSGRVYVAYSPLEERSELNPAIQRLVGLFRYKRVIVQTACLGEEGCVEDIPIVNCEGVISVVWVRSSNETMMSRDGSCIVVEGDIAGLERLTNRILIEEVL